MIIPEWENHRRKVDHPFFLHCNHLVCLSMHWFPIFIETCHRYSHFSHLSSIKGTKSQTDFGGKTSKCIFSPRVLVLKFDSGWIFTAKLQTLGKKKVSIWSPNTAFITRAQLHCCASDPFILRCAIWEMPASKCSKMRNYSACLTNQK